MRSVVAVAVISAIAAPTPARADAPTTSASPSGDADRPGSPGLAGGVRGTVIFEGEVPDRSPNVKSTDLACGKTAATADDLLVTKGKLRDVVVRISAGAAANHAPDQPLPASPAVIEQTGCEYAPHVLALRAGGKLVVRNRDQTFHNVHGVVRGKDLFNKPQPKGAPELPIDDVSTAQPGDVIELRCDVHPWMHAYALVVDTPYVAVTDDAGAFAITGLPPGRYTLEAWHPVLGTRTLDIVVGTGNKAVATARLSFKH